MQTVFSTMQRYRFRTLLALAALVLMSSAPRSTQAQQPDWRQTIQIIAPIDQEGVTGALLDTLVNVMQRNDLSFHRSPQDGGPLSYSELESQLLNEGLDYTSANRAFISYRFEADRRGLTTHIDSLFFIYRPEMEEGTDIPILAVDASHPVIDRMLRNSGMQLRTNEVAFEPFYEQLLFHNLPESQLVMLGGDVIRDPQEAESERLRVLQTVRRFLY